MWEGLELLFKNIKDPLMILLFFMMGGLFLVVKMLIKLLLSRDQYIEQLHKCLSEGLGESNVTQAKLVTLIEGMVYGRRVS